MDIAPCGIGDRSSSREGYRGVAKTSIWKNLVLLGVSGLVALGGAEMSMRLVPGLLPEETALRLHWDAIRNMPTAAVADSLLGFRYPPDFEGFVDRGDTRFAYTTDADGFRNPGEPVGAADIVIVGDSHVFGWGVSDDETWVYLLDTSLPDLAIRNLGLIGAAPEQYTRVLERYGLGTPPEHPDHVLYMVFPGNDGRDQRLFDDWQSAGSRGNFDVWRFGGGDGPGLLERSALLKLVKAAMDGRALRGRTVEFADGGRVRIARGAYASGQRELVDGTATRASILASIARGRALADSIGADFTLLLMPTKAEVYVGSDEAPPELISAIRPALDAAGYEILDLTDVLQERNSEALFFEIDGHLNVRGNQVVANAVREFLETRNGTSSGG